MVSGGTSGTCDRVTQGTSETADIGSSIDNMAPLTEDALAQWAAIKNIVANMPDVVDAGIDLWPGTIDVCVGIGWLVALLDDVQNRYGDEIWPFVHGQATDAIALAVRAEAPIYANERVIEESAIEFEGEEVNEEEIVDEFRKFLDDVSPDQFAVEEDDGEAEAR